LSTECAVAVCEILSLFERFAEHEEDLIAMQDSHPLRPRVRPVALREVVGVYRQADGRVVTSELVERAEELTVARRHVECVDVLVVVFGVQPVRVLKLPTDSHITHAVLYAVTAEYRK